MQFAQFITYLTNLPLPTTVPPYYQKTSKPIDLAFWDTLGLLCAIIFPASNNSDIALAKLIVLCQNLEYKDGQGNWHLVKNNMKDTTAFASFFTHGARIMLSGQPGIYPYIFQKISPDYRLFSTHDITLDNNAFIEEKIKSGARRFCGMKNAKQRSLNVAIYGYGNPHPHDITKTVSCDGSYGHLLLLTHQAQNREAILFGIENTAPLASDLYGQSHGIAGNRPKINVTGSGPKGVGFFNLLLAQNAPKINTQNDIYNIFRATAPDNIDQSSSIFNQALQVLFQDNINLENLITLLKSKFGKLKTQQEQLLYEQWLLHRHSMKR